MYAAWTRFACAIGSFRNASRRTFDERRGPRAVANRAMNESSAGVQSPRRSRAVQAIVRCVVLALTTCSCRSAAPAPGPDAAKSPATQATPTASAPSVHVNAVLARWADQHHEEAIALLVELCASNADDSALRAYDMSEREFISLPEAQREFLRMRMAERMSVMGAVGREAIGRGQAAAATGKLSEARRLLRAVKRLGAANRGPQVTLVADLVGQALEDRADIALAELGQDMPTSLPARSNGP